MRRNPGACGAERWYCGACPAGSWSLNIDGTRCPAAPTDRDPPQCLTCPGRTYQRCRLINHSALQPLGLTLPGSCEVVYSLFSQPEDLNHLDSLLPPHCNLVLYDRRPGDAACTGIPRRLMQNRNATCTRLDNEYGADATHTWVHHVATAYHRLPDFVIFLGRLAARNSWQHLRASCRASSFGASKDSFACARPMDSCDGFSPELTITSTHSLSSWVNKTLPQYYKEAIRPATVRPFGRWLEHYLVRLHAVVSAAAPPPHPRAPPSARRSAAVARRLRSTRAVGAIADARAARATVDRPAPARCRPAVRPAPRRHRAGRGGRWPRGDAHVARGGRPPG